VTAAAVALCLGAGLLLLQRVLRRRLDGVLAAVTLGLTLLGTFAFDLLARERRADAAASFALAALALFLRERPGPLDLRRAAAIGAAAGGAAALHWPGAALVLLALPREGERARVLGVAALAAAAVWGVASAVATAPPAAFTWQPLLALFGSRQGLLHLTPALWLGVLGLALQLRREGRAAGPLAAAVIGMVALHGACPQACPRERLAGVLPLLALPAGLLLRALRDAVRRAPGSAAWAAGALLACWNFLFMQQYARDMVPRDFPVAFAQVARGSAALVARAVGAPLSWPANWLFAARHHTGPERFDAAAGKRLPAGRDGALTIDVGHLDTDDALLLEGWSVRHRCGDAVCRAVEGRARLLLPPLSGPAVVVVRASGAGSLAAGPGAAQPLAETAADLRFPLDTADGLRAVTLHVPPPGRALVDTVTVRPAEGR
jgi:hypothetical protein